MVKNFFKNGASFLNLRQTTILSAALVIMASIAASKILGVIKLRLLSARFTPEEIGVYLAAFRLPNLLFELLVLGALSAAFIPVFTSFLTEEKKEEAWLVASSVINLGVLMVFFVSLPLFVFAERISSLLTPGFSSSQIQLMASFTRILLLGQVLPLIVGNFITGILQSFKHFLLPALAPVVYDLGIIIGILVFSATLGLYAPVVGVILGALFFLLVQIPVLFSFGFSYKPVLGIKHPGVQEIGRLMLPRTLGLSISQIDITADLILASLLGARSITIFNFAQTLQLLPISLFGATISQAALPTLSEEYAQKDLGKFRTTLLTSLFVILFLVFPASTLLVVLRVPIVRLAFGTKLFDWEATILTSITLALFSVSVFAQAAITLLVRAFYALHDSKTPVIIGIIAVLTNVLFSVLFILILKLPVWGLALSTSLASLLNACLLLVFLDKRVYFPRLTLVLTPLKIIIASFFTGIFLYIPMKILDQLVLDTTRTINLIILTAIASFVGFSVYLTLSVLLRIKEAKLFLGVLGKIRNFRQVLSQTPEVIESEKPNP